MKQLTNAHKKGIFGFWLAPSYKCNNRCRWCYAGSKLCHSIDMTLVDAKRYIKQMFDAGARTCILVGGEPSIYPHILQVVEYAANLGIRVKMMSNGRRFAQRSFVQDLKAAGIQNCSISIEGTEAVHDNITMREGSLSQAIRGLENCQLEDIPINSITTVGSYNLENIPDLVNFFQEFGLKRSAFNMCSSQPSGFEEGEDAGIVDLQDYVSLVEDIGLAYDFVSFYALVPLCLFDQDKLRELIELRRLIVSCALFARAVTVDPEGNLLPCTHMAGLSYGNLNEPEAIENFLAKKECDRTVLRTHAPSEKCVDCKLWNTCFGGCNLIWFSRSAQDHIRGVA